MSKLLSGVWFSDDVSVAALDRLLQQALGAGARALMILACDRNELDPNAISPILERLEVPVCGGVFPAVLYRQRQHERGYLVCGFARELKVETFASLTELTRLAPQARGEGLVVLVDGLGRQVDAFITALYGLLGPGTPVFGGGAGSLSLEQRPCLICNQGLYADGAQLIWWPEPVEVGVRHGWETLAGPFLVTEAADNLLHSLNFRPALQVYSEALAPHLDPSPDQLPFSEIARIYPFGMEKLDDQILVRDPIRAEGEALLCVGKVPVHAMVNILHGEAQALIEAASETVDAHWAGSRRQPLAFLFDCVSRKLFLGERFDDELAAIRARLPEDALLIGALTLGEIANSAGGPIQFHNRTAVVGVSD